MDSEEEKISRLRRAMYSRKVADKVSQTRARHGFEQANGMVPRDWQSSNEQGAPASSVAPRSVRVTRRVLWWALVAAGIFFIASAAAFGYYLLDGFGLGATSARNIDISVRGPVTVVGGERTELQIAVTNRNDVALELADLVITYPEGTRSTADFGTELTTQRIPLGRIEAGGRQQGTVAAVLIGAEGQRASIAIELEYRVQNSNAVFVAEDAYDFTFASAPVAMRVVANDEAIAGQPFTATVTVSSNADTVLRDAVLGVEYPFGFTFTSAEPETEGRNDFWELGDVEPGDEQTIIIRGTMAGAPGDERTFRFTLGTRTASSHQRVDVALVENEHRLALAQPFIGLTIVADRDEAGSADGISVTQAGEAVSVRISWRNHLSTALTDVVLVGHLEGLNIGGQTVNVVDGFYRSNDRSILWDKTTTGGTLANVAPGQTGTVQFSFVVPSLSSLGSLENPELTFTLNAAGRRTQSGVPQTLQSSVSHRVRVAAEPSFEAVTLYRTNPFGSVGPLPPSANDETTYAVVWLVSNALNNIEGARVTAQLPPYVRLLGPASPASERLTYNREDGTLTWDIGTVPAGAGYRSAQPRQITFPIGFTPSETQIGSAPALVTNQVLTGTDAFTGEEVRLVIPAVSTVMPRDPGFSTEEGTVVP